MEQLCHQVSKKEIPIFEVLHPDTQAVFVFDCSSAHGAFAPSALRVKNMNLHPGGKQSRLQDTVIPCNDPNIHLHLRGQPQTLSYDTSHPNPNQAGKPKGVQAFLEEQGIWQYYTQQTRKARKPILRLHCKSCKESNIHKDAIQRAEQLIREAEESGYFLSTSQCIANSINAISAKNNNGEDLETNNNNPEAETSDNCCWSCILSLQSDFVNKRPLLQTIIEEQGHICLFLPKFHCELNPIELFWSYIKQGELLQSTVL